jgi:hypothetical protein
MHSEPSGEFQSSEQLLEQRLNSEALAARPLFSEDLHVRVMTAIAAPHDAEADLVTPPIQHRSRRKMALWAAIAASMLIAVPLVAQFWTARDNSARTGQPTNGPGGLAVDNPAHVNISLDDINRNATLAFRLMVDQLPIEVPADEWELTSVN